MSVEETPSPPAPEISNAQFRLLADNLPVFCWLADATGHIYWYNRRWYDFTGTTPAEMEGWGWKSVHHPGSLSEVLERWEASLATGEPFEMVFPLRSASGVYKPFLTRIVPHKDDEGRITNWFGTNIDVSEQEAAKDALTQSNALLHRILDGLPLIASLQRADGTADFVNRRYADYVGSQPAGALQGRMASVHPDDREAYLASRQAAVDQRIDHEVEARILRHDGVWRWHAVRSIAFDANGSHLATAIDIHELRESADHIAVSEARARSTLDRLNAVVGAMSERVYACDIEGRPILFNDPYRTYDDTADGPVYPKSFVDAADVFDLQGHPLPVAEWPLSRALRGERVEGMELRIRSKHSGQEVIANFNAAPILGPKSEIAMAVLTSFDITDRKEAELALRESQARLRLSQDAGRIGSWDWDILTNKLRWSELQCRQFGVDPALGEDLDFELWRSTVHPDDLGACEEKLRERLETGSDSELEYRIVTPAGVRWMVGRGHVVRDEQGTPIRMVGVDVDITDRRQMEDELRHLAADLEAKIELEVAAREAAQGRLAHAQRMEALGQLAGGIAHDFNNVLQATQGGAALIARRPEDTERVRGLAQSIYDVADRGAAITRRLLAFSRRGDLKTEPVEAEPLFEAMVEIFSHTLGDGVSVKKEVQANLPPFLADKRQLETVLVNLGSNARDAMKGDGTLTLSATLESLSHDDGPHHPLSLAAGSYVRISVSDTGVGMEPEVLARASEPFFTTKGVGQGTGLGLAMARGFAEQCGGGLLIESTPGQGAVIKLWFPVTDRPAPLADGPDLSPSTSAPVVQSRARLLMVDDDAMVLEALAAQMEAEGYAVRRANSGEEALAQLDAAEKIDLMVTDLSMPSMNGLTLIQEVQARRPGLPAILLTGFATSAAEGALSGVTQGRFSVLNKPVNLLTLVEHVELNLEPSRPEQGSPGIG